ncbi:MAG TPA: AlpA family phage regulatory protein [Sphingopyxis sp.]|nr:AlpA family phage regulatory protein [Sphingopyxis sp.]HMP43947.1 AlpA family phage regulatory protein [Sphingopyxis sp.]HMQ20290.1 AlpA family phage regulatory protein [Sphingopyxis sp.]
MTGPATSPAAPAATPPAPPGRFLSIGEVMRQTSYSRTTIWRRIRDGTFPRPIKLGGRMRAWAERDIEQWKAEKDRARE